MGIVFLGPPGVGKGTQGKRYAAHLHAAHISTGEMLRTAVKEGTPLGQQVQRTLETGGLVGDRLMNEMVFDRLSRPDAGEQFVLDGYPRTIPQAEALESFLAEQKKAIEAVVLLVADEGEIQARLLSRDDGRSDDTPETIHRRLCTYNDQTKPLIDFYEHRQALVRIDGMGSRDDVFTRICQRLANRVTVPTPPPAEPL